MNSQTQTKAKTRKPLPRKARVAGGVPPSKATEPIAVQKARQRIRQLVKAVTADQDKSAVGLVLAIVNQETGSHEAANQIIDEYKLDELFGIQKVTQ